VDAARQDKSGEREEYQEGHENGVRNLFSLCADACGESNEIVSAEKVPGTYSELMPLLVQEAIPIRG
jgi:hypothetical protein